MGICRKLLFFLNVLGLAAFVACETSPLGRTQLHLLNDAEIEAAGLTAFAKLKADTPPAQDARVTAHVRCVAGAIIQQIRDPRAQGTWEVVVFERDEANAFALPGRKIGVYSGILKYAQNQDQLAAVLAHEVGHVLSNHFNERMSTAYATQSGLQALQVLGGASSAAHPRLLAVLGLGAQVGIMMPFERTQETEADLLGLDLMAQAGFDPRQSVQLWSNMAAAGGASVPGFLSTHPTRETRMRDLNSRMPKTQLLYEQAVALGKRPDC
jgi:predicted Zn-dependent protease